jgi:hypothetical protein
LRPVKHIALLALLAGCLVAAGCGSDEEGAPIPANSAAALQSRLQSIQNRIDNGSVGACEDVTGTRDPDTTPVQQTIDGLPDDVDQDVRDALQQGFDRLFELVDERCAELQDETDTDTNTTPVEPPATDTETETTTTETVPTNTDTVPTEPTTPTTPTTPEEPPSTGDETTDQGGGILAPGENGQ